MRGFVPIPSPSPAKVVSPASCPSCHSTAILTTAKSPDVDSYWRCATCGDIWNAARAQSDRHGAHRWR